MTEYSCEVWLAHKYTFHVQAENIDEALEKVKKIAAEGADKGEIIVEVSVNGWESHG